MPSLTGWGEEVARLPPWLPRRHAALGRWIGRRRFESNDLVKWGWRLNIPSNLTDMSALSDPFAQYLLLWVILCAATTVWLLAVMHTPVLRIPSYPSDPHPLLAELKQTKVCPPVAWMPPFRHRGELGDVLRTLNFTLGVELGVQQGHYSMALLSKWQIANTFVMVDLWAHQEHYLDAANRHQQVQEQFKQTALKHGQQMISAGYLKELVVCQNYTVHCALDYADGYFDFIYVDARHDYKGVLQDLVTWWPKLKAGGIMAGHDYVTNQEVLPSQDWSINYDGSKDETGRVVKGAVDDFFSDKLGHLHGCPRQITVGYRERHWNTWATRK